MIRADQRDNEEEKDMENGLFREVSIDAAGAALTSPGIFIVNDKAQPKVVDMSGFVFDPGQLKISLALPGQRLRALSVQHSNANGVVRLGQVWYAGVINGTQTVCAVPLNNGGVQSLLTRMLMWAGDIPAVYGFGVWTMAALTNTDRVQISAILEGGE